MARSWRSSDAASPSRDDVGESSERRSNYKGGVPVMPLGPGAYIAEEVLPWVDSSGNIVPATGGRAVGTPAPSSGGSPPPPAPPPPDGGTPKPAGAQKHPVQPKAAAPHAPVVNVREWRELEDRDEPYGQFARSQDSAPTEGLRECSSSCVPLSVSRRARIQPLASAPSRLPVSGARSPAHIRLNRDGSPVSFGCPRSDAQPNAVHRWAESSARPWSGQAFGVCGTSRSLESFGGRHVAACRRRLCDARAPFGTHVRKRA